MLFSDKDDENNERLTFPYNMRDKILLIRNTNTNYYRFSIIYGDASDIEYHHTLTVIHRSEGSDDLMKLFYRRYGSVNVGNGWFMFDDNLRDKVVEEIRSIQTIYGYLRDKERFTTRDAFTAAPIYGQIVKDDYDLCYGLYVNHKKVDGTKETIADFSRRAIDAGKFLLQIIDDFIINGSYNPSDFETVKNTKILAEWLRSRYSEEAIYQLQEQRSAKNSYLPKIIRNKKGIITRVDISNISFGVCESKNIHNDIMHLERLGRQGREIKDYFDNDLRCGLFFVSGRDEPTYKHYEVPGYAYVIGVMLEGQLSLYIDRIRRQPLPTTSDIVYPNTDELMSLAIYLKNKNIYRKKYVVDIPEIVRLADAGHTPAQIVDIQAAKAGPKLNIIQA